MSVSDKATVITDSLPDRTTRPDAFGFLINEVVKKIEVCVLQFCPEQVTDVVLINTNT